MFVKIIITLPAYEKLYSLFIRFTPNHQGVNRQGVAKQI